MFENGNSINEGVLMDYSKEKRELAKIYFEHGFTVKDVETCLRENFGSSLAGSELIAIRKAIPNIQYGKRDNYDIITRTAIDRDFFRRKTFELMAEMTSSKRDH